MAANRAAGPLAGQQNPWSFSLAELLIAITYVCILMGVTLPFPEWGAFLWTLSAIALGRTVWFSIAWKRAGQPTRPLEQVGSFVESLAVLGLVSAAAAVAFVGVCFPLGASVTNCCSPNHSDALSACAWIFGGLAGLGGGGILLWWLCIVPIVQWWRTGRPPTIVMRLAALGWSMMTLSSTFLGSATLAAVAGWTWLRFVAAKLEQRDERQFRLALYWMLLAGYVLGMLLGVVAGRLVAAAGRKRFWPCLAAAGLAIVVLLAVAARGMSPAGANEEPIVPLAMVGMLVAFVVGLVIRRFFPWEASRRNSDQQDRS